MNQPTTDNAVRVSVDVNVSQERAFDVFTRKFATWWPVAHHIGANDPVDVVIEPMVGGRWYERDADGNECDWGSVLEWDEPNRILLGWQLTPEFTYDPDPALRTEVEVRFVATGASSTHVELEHRGFEVHGERGDAMRTSVSAEGGWSSLLKLFASSAAAP